MRELCYLLLLCVNLHFIGAQVEYDYVDSCPEDNGYFADAFQCDRYYECQLGEVSEHYCPDGLVFDETSTAFAKCSFPFSIDCTGRDDLQKPQPSPGCPRKNGYFPHPDPTVCDIFHFCVDGVPNPVTCPSGLIFDPKKGQCAWSDQTDRKGCTSEDLSDFTCPDDGASPHEHPRYPDPADCQYFYLCIEGKARRNGCSEGLVFSPTSLSCESQDNVEGRCHTWYNETYLETMKIPVTTRPRASPQGPTISPDVLANRRRPQAPEVPRRQSPSRPAPQTSFQPAPARGALDTSYDIADLPPELASLALNSDLGVIDSRGNSLQKNQGPLEFSKSVPKVSSPSIAFNQESSIVDDERDQFLTELRDRNTDNPRTPTVGSRRPANSFADSRLPEQTVEPEQTFGRPIGSRRPPPALPRRKSPSGLRTRPQRPHEPQGIEPQESVLEGSGFSASSPIEAPVPDNFGQRRVPASFSNARPRPSNVVADQVEEEEPAPQSQPTGFGRRRVPSGASRGSARPQPQPASVNEDVDQGTRSQGSRRPGFRTRGGVPRRQPVGIVEESPAAVDQQPAEAVLEQQPQPQTTRTRQVLRRHRRPQPAVAEAASETVVDSPAEAQEDGQPFGSRRGPQFSRGSSRRNQGSNEPASSPRDQDTAGGRQRGRLEVTQLNSLPPLREIEEDHSDFDHFSAVGQRNRGPQ